MTYREITTLCQEVGFLTRVRGVLTAVACETLSDPTTGVVMDAQRAYARLVLRDPEYYISRGTLPLALGFQDRTDLDEATVSDLDLHARAVALLTVLA